MVHRCSLRQLFANAAASRVAASIAVNVPLWTGATFQSGAVAYAHSRRLSAGVSDDAFMIAAERSVHDSHPPIVVSKVSAPHRLRIPLVLWRGCRSVAGCLFAVAVTLEISEPPFKAALAFFPCISVPRARIAILKQIASTNAQS